MGSKVISSLGLLNEHLAEYAAYFGVRPNDNHYGVPYPGSFILDEQGRVVEKWFEAHHRYRPSPVAQLEKSFAGVSSRPLARAEAEAGDVGVVASIGQDTYRPTQKLRLNLQVNLPPGLHIYGPPTAGDYTPLSVTLDPLECLEMGPLELPPGRPFRLEGLAEELYVYEGAVRAALPFWLLGNVGEVVLTARVRYQACSDRECYPPAEVTVDLPLQGLDLVRG